MRLDVLHKLINRREGFHFESRSKGYLACKSGRGHLSMRRRAGPRRFGLPMPWEAPRSGQLRHRLSDETNKNRPWHGMLRPRGTGGIPTIGRYKAARPKTGLGPALGGEHRVASKYSTTRRASGPRSRRDSQSHLHSSGQFLRGGRDRWYSTKIWREQAVPPSGTSVPRSARANRLSWWSHRSHRSLPPKVRRTACSTTGTTGPLLGTIILSKQEYLPYDRGKLLNRWCEFIVALLYDNDTYRYK
jgi:hypothetical protein